LHDNLLKGRLILVSRPLACVPSMACWGKGARLLSKHRRLQKPSGFARLPRNSRPQQQPVPCSFPFSA